MVQIRQNCSAGLARPRCLRADAPSV